MIVLLAVALIHVTSAYNDIETEGKKLLDKLDRCTLSYPNWVFVFMASVNYISRCHDSFLNCVTCHELY